MPYVHEALPFDEDTIRLLVLEPSNDPNAKIRCSFRGSVQLSQRPRYEAVSYAWGGTQRTRQISINRRSFLVGENLYQFLLRLRVPDQPRVLWIDALCIDQTKSGEKGHQIKSMPVIYSTAERVIVWLGNAADGSDELMMYAGYRDVFGDALSKVPDDLPQQVSSFFARRYWNRTWVVQELFMAKDLLFYCGSYQMEERSFQRFLQEVRKLCPTTEQGEKIFALVIHRVPGEGGQYVRTRSLAELLTEYWNTDCEDVRDKVYALLGLLPKYDAGKSIPVDYAATRTQLFLRVIEFLDFFTDSSTGAEALARALELTWSAILRAIKTDAWRGTWFPERYASIWVSTKDRPIEIAPLSRSKTDSEKPQLSFSTIGGQIWLTTCELEARDECWTFEDRRFALLFRRLDCQATSQRICIGTAWPSVLDYVGPDSDIRDIRALEQYLGETSRLSSIQIESKDSSGRILKISQRLLATIHAYTTLRQRGGILSLGPKPRLQRDRDYIPCSYTPLTDCEQTCSGDRLSVTKSVLLASRGFCHTARRHSK